MNIVKNKLLLMMTLFAMLQPAAVAALTVADDNNATATTAIPLERATLSPLATLQEFSGSFQSIGDDNFGDDVLDPERAFILSSYFDDKNQLLIRLDIANGYYIYRDKFKFAVAPDSNITINPVSLPKGKNKHDEFFGDIQVYYNNVEFPVTFNGATKNQAPFNLTVTYQGCAERGVCYPAISKPLNVNVTEQTVALQLDTNNSWATQTTELLSATATSSATENQSEQDQFADIISNENIFYIVGAFFLAGLLLTFTPCVFPMVPILSGIIAGQGQSITTRKAFILSLVYVLAMATTYAVAGAIVGRFGAEFNLQAWFQNPIILSSFAAIFVLLALSMFGFYELKIPAAMQQRLNAFSHSQQGGHLIGVAMMGFLSALIVGPCITAPLVGALLYIAHTQDTLIGGITLFALGLGIACLGFFILIPFLYFRLTRKYDAMFPEYHRIVPLPSVMGAVARTGLYAYFIVFRNLHKDKRHKITYEVTNNYDFRGNALRMDIVLS
ncbi:MAG: protein-disulfide reductase DsbD, partial [Gammaproteobacteria bacterium]|nr:protein-disulfide reductase DsbD [Gammaproteobacteria bacterium]